MKKSVLLTGASGFIASHLSDYLSKKKIRVILFDKKRSPYLKKGQVMKIGNINNIKHLNKVTKNVHTVFHFAATADLKEADDNPFLTLENNILGTIKLLKACVKNKVRKFQVNSRAS